MNSMTGFGESAGDNKSHRVSVTARSVNHRFLDVMVRVGDEHRALESALSELVRSRLLRGRVELRVSVEPLGDRPVEVAVRQELLRELLTKLEPLREEGLIGGEVGVADLARLPQVISVAERPQDWTDDDSELVLSVAKAAIGQLEDARAHEGASLEGVLLEKISTLEECVADLESKRNGVERERLGTLRERLAELLTADQVPEERLAQEAAILVEKSDVREELDRLSTHLGHFRSLCAGDGPHGRRLEFLVQELQRELNTLGGKCRDSAMAHDVVEGKLLCEQLREQLLNVE